MLSLGKSSFWQNASPGGAIADFRSVWKQAGARRWPFVALAMATTFSVFSMIFQESWRGPPAKPTVVYINSWTAGRSDAEIMATNAENQKVQDLLAAEQARRDAKVKDIYRTLGRVSGMDVDAIERKAKLDAAAEKAAEQKAIGLAPPHGTTPNGATPVEAAPVGKP